MKDDIRLLIADGQLLTRDLLAERIATEPDVSASVTGTMDQCLARLQADCTDVLLLDSGLPGLSPVSGVRTIADLFPHISIVSLCARLTDTWIVETQRAGSRCLTTRCDPLDALLIAIRAAASGESFLSRTVQQRLALTPCSRTGVGKLATRVEALTGREIEVLTQVANGLSSKEIAALMRLSARTVEAHCARVMRKLGLRDRVALTRFAIAEGVVAL